MNTEFYPLAHPLSEKQMAYRIQNSIIKGSLVGSGPTSVVGIATAYGLDGPGIESRWG